MGDGPELAKGPGVETSDSLELDKGPAYGTGLAEGTGVGTVNGPELAEGPDVGIATCQAMALPRRTARGCTRDRASGRAT